MGWIRPEDRMPPSGLLVLIEASGYITNSLIADHDYYLATWIDNPDGGRDPFWLVHGSSEDYLGHLVRFEDPEVHAWMPLPKHYQKPRHTAAPANMMEYPMFESSPDWLYKGEAVWEQRTIEDVLADMERGDLDGSSKKDGKKSVYSLH